MPSGRNPASRSLTFRTAIEADAESISRLVNSAYRGDTSRRGWTTEADLLGGQRTDPELVLEMIRSASHRIELASETDGHLVGCVHLHKEDRNVCYIGMLTVEPALQGNGLGTMLLDHVERTALAWGCRAARMTVIDRRQELLRYYERRGYASSGVTLPFPEDDPRFGLPRVRGLMFLELRKSLDMHTV